MLGPCAVLTHGRPNRMHIRQRMHLSLAGAGSAAARLIQPVRGTAALRTRGAEGCWSGPAFPFAVQQTCRDVCRLEHPAAAPSKPADRLGPRARRQPAEPDAGRAQARRVRPSARGRGERASRDQAPAAWGGARRSVSFSLLGAIAEEVLHLTRERAVEGLRAALARGRKVGRPRKLLVADLAAARAMLKDPHPDRAGGQAAGVSRATVCACVPRPGRGAAARRPSGRHTART